MEAKSCPLSQVSALTMHPHTLALSTPHALAGAAKLYMHRDIMLIG